MDNFHLGQKLRTRDVCVAKSSPAWRQLLPSLMQFLAMATWDGTHCIKYPTPFAKQVLVTFEFQHVSSSIVISSIMWFVTLQLIAPHGFDDSYYKYTLMDTVGLAGHETEYGMIKAAQICANGTGGKGAVANVSSQDVFQKMADLMRLNCVQRAYVAPTKWQEI